MRSAHGGKRYGSGRKPKPKVGSELVKARVLAHPSVPPAAPPEIGEFDPPEDFTKDERNVWLRQAPHAIKNRTLTTATALSFERYCRIVVLERNEAKSSVAGKANHRGLMKQVDAYEQQFMLTAAGKPMEVSASPAAIDENEAFFLGPRGS